MGAALHEFPESIELTREEYRAQHAALEAALDIVDRFPEVDLDGDVRSLAQAALRTLLARIWPVLDDLDDDE